MKSEEVFNAWKEEKSQIDLSENFADEVMNQVYQYAQKKREPLFDVQWLVELISAHPLAKAGLIAAGAVAGFIRMAFTVYMFLGT
jgi:hypothetical protein